MRVVRKHPCAISFRMFQSLSNCGDLTRHRHKDRLSHQTLEHFQWLHHVQGPEILQRHPAQPLHIWQVEDGSREAPPLYGQSSFMTPLHSIQEKPPRVPPPTVQESGAITCTTCPIWENNAALQKAQFCPRYPCMFLCIKQIDDGILRFALLACRSPPSRPTNAQCSQSIFIS